MDIQFVAQIDASADVVAFPVRKGEAGALGALLGALAKQARFDGAAGSVAETAAFDGDRATRLLLVGIGPLAWRRRSALLTATLLAGVGFQTLSYGAFWGNEGGILVAGLSLSVILLALRQPATLARDGGALGRVLGGGNLVSGLGKAHGKSG